MIRALLLIALCFSPEQSQAQEYFQQRVDYEIDVTLNDETHVLDGFITMEYHNNSPQALDSVIIHLWPNAYSSRSTELGRQLRERGDFKLEFSEEYERGEISGLKFNIDDRPIAYKQLKGLVDVAVLELEEPLLSGNSIRISTPFRVQIPSSRFSRLGHIGQSYQITQWYPKPAVYDQEGWHPMSYLNQGEFYSEFGSFHVTITLPENYVVGATGELQEESEKEFLMDLAKASSQSPWVEKNNDFPKSSDTMKTIHYHQDSIHDFAWFADKRFNVLHKRFQLDSGREVDGWVYFTNNHSEAWTKSMDYVVQGTKHYSRLVGDYPYSHVSVVDGTLAAGGGMEYPMITVVNGTSNDMSLEQVIVHEIGHNWFYGILGSNERRYPWMDEGINSYYEERYFEMKYPNRPRRLMDMLRGTGAGQQETAYRLMSCRHQDQELLLSSEDFSSLNYGAMVYMKGALAMSHLYSVLGEDLFDDLMQEYYSDWRFRHPGIQDMQSSYEANSGLDLSWFFDGVLSENMKIDHRICCLDEEDNSVKVKSRTSYEGPFYVGFYQDSVLVDLEVADGESAVVNTESEFDKAIIDPFSYSLDSRRTNNSIRTKGILRTWDFPDFKPIIGIGLSENPSIYYAPALGWNEQDKWMLGAYLSNTEIITKPFEWTVVPMFSTSSEDLVGLADIRFSIFPIENDPDRINLSLGAKRFSLKSVHSDEVSYLKLEPRVEYAIKDPSEKKGAHLFFYQFHFIHQSFKADEVFHFEDEATVEDEFIFNELGYSYSRSRGLNQIGCDVMLEIHDSYQKLSAEGRFSQIYDKHENRWSVRVYGGQMWTQDFIPIGAQLGLNGQGPTIRMTDGTYDDYRFDHLLLGRGEMEGLTSQQVVSNRGGFMQRSLVGFSDDWVLSFNADFDIPLPLPLSIYANYGFFDTSQDVETLYETGVRVKLIEDFFEVSFPLIQSIEIQDAYETSGIKYPETIRFQLRLDKLGFRKLIDNFSI